MSDGRKRLVDSVQAMGQELIDRAADIVGQMEGLTDLDIILKFPCCYTGNEPEFQAPSMKIIKKNYPKQAMYAFFGTDFVKKAKQEDFDRF